MKFTLATCVRNEGPYLLEWVAHYKLLGFDRIVIFSNDNDDGSDELLAGLQNEKLIDWRPRTLEPNQSPQLSAYKLFSKELFDDPKEHGGYLAWLDCDEFLVLKQHGTIEKLLESYRYPDALFINWKHFGSAGQQEYQRGLTVSRFLTCNPKSSLNIFGKSISRIEPRLYSFISNHRPIPLKDDVWGRVVYAAEGPNDVLVAKEIIYGSHPSKLPDTPMFHEVSQLNHYAVRSKEEYGWKSIRGNGRLALNDEKIHFKDSYFGQHDLNARREELAHEKYAEPIKSFISGLPAKLVASEAEIIGQIIDRNRSIMKQEISLDEVDGKSEANGLKEVGRRNLQHGSEQKSLFVLRCHNFGESESSLLNSVVPYFGRENILIVADERMQSVAAKEWEKAALTDEKIRAMGIFEHPNCGWLCGDYFYYIACEERPDYDYFWLCEPDVYFSFADIKDFFQEFENNSADLLAPRFCKKDKEWPWARTAVLISDDFYGCQFPITRLSKEAIKHLQSQRRALTTRFEQNKLPILKWPNDEAFVSTTLQRDGFSCQNLNLVSQFFGIDFSFSPILWDVAHGRPKVNRVLHPVLRMPQFQQKVSKAFRSKIIKNIVIYFGDNVFPNATAEASLDITLNTLDVVYREIRSNLLKSHPDLLTHGVGQVDSVFQEALALRKYVIKQHAIKKRHRKAEFSPAKPENFVLGEGNVLEQFDVTGYSPYAFDYAKKTFYLTQNDKHIEDGSFLYQAQFSNASSVVTLPLAIAEDVYGIYTEQLQPTFIFSIGRCGSTLLSKLTKGIGKINVSEPDIFTTSILNQKKIKPYEANQVLFYTVRALEEFFEAPSSQLVIKLRAGCNRAFAGIHRNFPSARYVFISRQVYPWSKSFIKAFDWGNEQLFNTLVGFIDALVFCKQNGVEIYHLSYEDLIEKPREALRLLANDDSAEFNEQFIDSVMSKHSQIGTGLDEMQKVSPSEVERRAREFEEFWHKNKPAEKIKLIDIVL